MNHAKKNISLSLENKPTTREAPIPETKEEQPKEKELKKD